MPMAIQEERWKEDQRFQIAQSEALCSIILTGMYFLWWYGVAYSDGVVGESTVFGLPGCFFSVLS